MCLVQSTFVGVDPTAMSAVQIQIDQQLYEIDIQPFDDLPKLRDKIFLLHNIQLSPFTLYYSDGGTMAPVPETVPMSSLGIKNRAILIAKRKGEEAAAAHQRQNTATSASSYSPPLGRSPSTNSTLVSPHGAADPFGRLEETLTMISPPRSGSLSASPQSATLQPSPTHNINRQMSTPMQSPLTPLQAKRNSVPDATSPQPNTPLPPFHGRVASLTPSHQQQLATSPHHSQQQQPQPRLARHNSSPSGNPFAQFGFAQSTSPSTNGGMLSPPQQSHLHQQQPLSPSACNPFDEVGTSGAVHHTPVGSSSIVTPSSTSPLANARQLSVQTNIAGGGSADSLRIVTPEQVFTQPTPLAAFPRAATTSARERMQAKKNMSLSLGSPLPSRLMNNPAAGNFSSPSNPFLAIEQASATSSAAGSRRVSVSGAPMSASHLQSPSLGTPNMVGPSPALVVTGSEHLAPHLQLLLDEVEKESADLVRDHDDQIGLKSYALDGLRARVATIRAERAAKEQAHAIQLEQWTRDIAEAQANLAEEERKTKAYLMSLESEKLSHDRRLTDLEAQASHFHLARLDARKVLDTWLGGFSKLLGQAAIAREEHTTKAREERTRVLEKAIQKIEAETEIADELIAMLWKRRQARKESTEGATAASGGASSSDGISSSDAPPLTSSLPDVLSSSSSLHHHHRRTSSPHLGSGVWKKELEAMRQGGVFKQMKITNENENEQQETNTTTDTNNMNADETTSEQTNVDTKQ